MRTPNSNNFQEQRLHDRKMMKFFLEIQAAVVEDQTRRPVRFDEFLTLKEKILL